MYSSSARLGNQHSTASQSPDSGINQKLIQIRAIEISHHMEKSKFENEQV